LLQRGSKDRVFDPAGGIVSMPPAFAYPERLTDRPGSAVYSDNPRNGSPTRKRFGRHTTTWFIAILSE
jgi:hypothetical protein